VNERRHTLHKFRPMTEDGYQAAAIAVSQMLKTHGVCSATFAVVHALNRYYGGKVGHENCIDVARLRAGLPARSHR